MTRELPATVPAVAVKINKGQTDEIIFLGGIMLLTIILVLIPLSVSGTYSSALTEEERIINAFEAREGFIPNPLLLMAERSGVLPAFMEHA